MSFTGPFYISYQMGRRESSVQCLQRGSSVDISMGGGRIQKALNPVLLRMTEGGK